MFEEVYMDNSKVENSKDYIPGHDRYFESFAQAKFFGESARRFISIIEGCAKVHPVIDCINTHNYRCVFYRG